MKKLLILIAICISTAICQTTEPTLPIGNYFEGAFAKNLLGVASLVMRIEQNEEAKPFSSDFLAKIGKSSNEQSSNFKEKAAEYLSKLTKHQNAMDSKTELRERIRDLRTQNTQSMTYLTPFINGLPSSDPAIIEFKRFMDDFTDLETRIIEFFTLKKSETADRLKLFSNMNKSPDMLARILIDLSGPERIMRKVLSKEKFVDPIFASFYSMFRNQAILLTIARVAKEEITRPEFLQKPELISNLKMQISFSYENFLKMMVKANAWRETEGFKYTSLFTKEEQESLKENNPVSHPTMQTLFLIDQETEKLRAKYHYVTIKVCGSYQDVKMKKAPVTDIITETVGKCTVHCLRYPKSLAPKSSAVKGFPQVLRKNSISVLDVARNYDNYATANDIMATIRKPTEYGLIAVAATRTRLDVLDDVYSDEGGYKVVLDLVGNHEFVNPNYWREMLHEKSSMKVVGYFIDPVE